jgi:hypothetical protein
VNVSIDTSRQEYLVYFSITNNGWASWLRQSFFDCVDVDWDRDRDFDRKWLWLYRLNGYRLYDLRLDGFCFYYNLFDLRFDRLWGRGN